MTRSDDAPTIAERYSRATQTKNLRLTEGRCAADVLIASGLSHGNGAIFQRLRGEFDTVHAEVARHQAGAINTRLVVMTRLKTLAAGKLEAQQMAAARALRLGLDTDAQQIANLAWQAISAWLDPNCGHCEGRGKNGGYGAPEVICRHCGGSGKRRGFVGKTESERRFVEALIVVIEESVESHSAQIGRHLRAP